MRLGEKEIGEASSLLQRTNIARPMTNETLKGFPPPPSML